MIKTSAQEACRRYHIKTAMKFDAYGNPIEESSSILPALGGAAAGGAAAHYLFPNEGARKFREGAAKFTPEMTEASRKAGKDWAAKGFGHEIKDVVKNSKGQVMRGTKFHAPSHVAKQFLQNKAFRANAPRMLGGIGAGLAGGVRSPQTPE